MTSINKSTRHQKIVGDFGEHLVCNWLSRSGFEVTIVDHTGIDVIAYRPGEERLGITVKSRTRLPGTESSGVYIFRKPQDRKKLEDACKAFACKPWIAIYVESEKTADLYLTSLANYDGKYRAQQSRKIEKLVTEGWRMTANEMEKYSADTQVRHIQIEFIDQNWWEPVAPLTDEVESPL
jgi:Holliday junction resolvase-like predicted endonuclease